MLLSSFLLLFALAPCFSQATALNSISSNNGRLAPLKKATTASPSSLIVEYYEAGPSSGPAVILVHGFPYSIDAFVSVVPLLVNQGYRVIVPYLRGYGGTRFVHPDTLRSAEQAALGYDIIALMDAIHLDTAICAGYDWGTVAVNVATALWPERCTRMVAANSYLIQNRSTAWQPSDPNSEATKWYYYLFLTPRGAAGLAEAPKEWTQTLWEKNSVGWNFTEEYLDLTVTSLLNPDFVDIAVNFYRNRLLYAPGDPAFVDLADKLDHQPPITVPSVTLDPENSVVLTPNNGSATAKFFTGPRCHYQIPDVGENIPYQAPKTFANAIMEVSRLSASNTKCGGIF
ncbi:alpha/beta hydrolase [Aspergillus clavatus NRRL 1]|uniref:Alpha/beta fold family hydrolase, putative n=1 Tax=Aspergillus clavatus (strain ATCC 1007 / CBS 513.65 / DSM 816 / NCTC 3887 / NRRL 1 / QM 1276 / 107) TaxID=344612 RepID=A1CLN8_ASPCL|nr:alpha/beta fold family hydrolase, putative [Aspergillus clavatus NRRL 1]EAW09017.1 alpha/beta fold family hydrolase, putative [Aspergillus clavatus NRRL 1]